MARADIAQQVRSFGAIRNEDGTRAHVYCSLCYEPETGESAAELRARGRRPVKRGGSLRILRQLARSVALYVDGVAVFEDVVSVDDEGETITTRVYQLDDAASQPAIRIHCDECHGAQVWQPPHDKAVGRAEVRKRIKGRALAEMITVANERQRRAREGRRNPAPLPDWLTQGNT